MQPLYLVSSFPLTFEAMNPPKPSLVVFEKAIFALSKFQKNLENRPKNTKKPRFHEIPVSGRCSHEKWANFLL